MRTDLNRFPFVFFPKKLNQQGKELQTLFKHNLNSQSDPFSSLLEKIRRTPYSQLDQLSKQLSIEELDLIIKPYPFANRNEPVLVRKITHILMKRYTPKIGRHVWMHYQHDQEHPEIFALLRYAFQVQEPRLRFDDYESKQWSILSQAMSDIDPIQSLAQQLVDSRQSIRKTLRTWRIQPKSLLEQRLLYTMIHLGLSNDRWIKRIKERWIIQQMKRLSKEQLTPYVVAYVQSRNADTFYAEELMTFFRDRFGDPQQKEENWGFLDKQSLEKVKQYYMKSQLKKFFAQDHNSHRFRFWEKYLDKVSIYELHKMQSVLFLFFPEFVVVEFAGTGNAAYFYHPEGFQKVVRPPYEKTQKEGYLKVQTRYQNGIPVFINRISHQGSWKKRMSEVVERYLEGNF